MMLLAAAMHGIQIPHVIQKITGVVELPEVR
jgi:hypothetical protein